LTVHAIGGGWGQEVPDDQHTECVAIIRGTDIPRVAVGDFSSVPRRYETASKLKTRLLRPGDIVIEVSGGSAASGQHTGRSLVMSAQAIEMLGGRVIPASFCRLLRLAQSEVDPTFVCYQIHGLHLSGDIAEFENQSTGIANFQFTRFVEAVCPALAGVEDQRNVGQALRLLDDRIALLRETNATLEAIAQALFKSWFVDFDPVRAKQQGLAPAGMDEATAALFPDSFEESALGLVPTGWPCIDLGELTRRCGGTIQTGPFGSQLHAKDYVEAGIPVVMPKDIAGRRVSTESIARVGVADVERLSRHKLQVGDIVFSRRGDVERHALITERELGWLCGTGCLLVRPGPRWASSGFLSLLLDASRARTWLVQHAVGATMPNLNTGILSSVPLVLPPHALLVTFDAVVALTEKQRSRNATMAETLASLRDTLLPRLISGRLRLPQAEAIGAEVAA
jgi:type I restriction enzyme S subunit